MNYHEELQSLLPQQTRSLQRYFLPNEEWVWVRKVGGGNPMIYYKLLEILTVYIFRLPIFRPVYRGKKHAIMDEAARLDALAKAHILAPKLLAHNENGLMMSDLGKGQTLKTLDNLMANRAECKMAIFPVWKMGIDALIALHNKGQYLSQAFARNMLEMPDKQVLFLDFEEDPIHKLTLTECQVRDILCYMLSSVHYFWDEDDIDNALNYCAEQRNTAAPETLALFRQTIKKFKWMRFLYSPYLMGRDGKRFARTVRFLAKLLDRVQK
ncbi:MAG: hypothetical protein IKI11_04610 [Neisseriaceae bacterium]|nr:hypothetical protein [Neisseriaceae bacterium]